METGGGKLKGSEGLQDSGVLTNVRIVGVPEREARVKRAERRCEEVMDENTPNLMKDAHANSEEA